jgi:anti-sigma factor RsiW
MTSPSLRDIETLSAYLDGQVSPSERTHLEKRLLMSAELAEALQELRQTRALLRLTPQRRAPRNFRLTPRMAGIRPPVPRLVPVFTWASAMAMLLFIFTLGTSLVGRLSFGAAAPMLAAAPSAGIGGGPPAAATQAPVLAAPATAAPATTAPALAAPAPLRITDQTVQETPTAEAFGKSAAQATQPAAEHALQPPSAQNTQQKPPNHWLFIWPGVGVLLGILALLAQWINQRSFQQKNPPG